MQSKFLQLHTLTGYVATLLNRDDAGNAKRLPFGGATRIRVSSQCLKRHWREATGEWSLADLGPGKSTRSRRIFSHVIAERLRVHHWPDEKIAHTLRPLRAAVLGESIKAQKARKAKKSEEEAVAELDTPQVIVLGQPEIDFLTNLALELGQDDGAETAKAVKEYFRNKESKNNLKALRKGSGLDAALFGRMVTSDLLARADAAVHVAHAFTVHAEEAEPDYFSALDDLVAEAGELGSGHIATSELTSGFFYSYVVVDLAQLVGNLSEDRDLAAEVVRRLPHLLATVSPGAKRGATAPYACAEFVVAELGNRQPRTLANAYTNAIRGKRDLKERAVAALDGYLGRYDAMYGSHEERQFSSMLPPVPDHCGQQASLADLADWAAAQLQT